jgi:glycosyltransferase involved in cell wall biosynthesis
MENVFNNYENQSYPNKELIIVLNNNKMDIDEWKSKALEYNNVKVFQMDEKEPLGRCLNLAIDNSDYPYLSKCDDDNYYAPYFLSDLMNAFCYTDAQIVGKLNYYCYLEGLKTLAMICPNMEHRYVNMLSGSALIINRNVFLQVRFSDKPTGCDSVFLKDCLNKGVLMYSTDRFNYVYKRHKSQANHTFKMQDEVFLKSCRVVDITDDFIKMVTV